MTVATKTDPIIVVVLYDFQGTQDNHLSLKEGEFVHVLRQENSGWWSGIAADGRTGWFPATYVDRVAVPKDGTSELAITPLSSSEPTEEEWAKYFTEDGQTYFVNQATGESRWSLPDAASLLATSFKENLSINLPEKHEENSFDVAFQEDSSFVELPTSTRFSFTSRNGDSNSRRSVTTSSSSKALAIPDNGKYGYVNNFWSDKGDKSGFDILVAKHRNGKEMCKDVSQLMGERARIEETYAKALLELAKTPLGDMESGTAKTAWNQVKFDMETQARSRLEFANKLVKEVEQPIVNFKNEQKKMRKNYEATIASDRRILMNKYSTALKMQKIYLQRAKEAEAADAVVNRSSTAELTKREIQKLEDNARRERKKASIAALDYRTSVEEYERIRCQWEEDMQTACIEFQAAEEERIDFIKSVLCKYLDVQKNVNTLCKESSEMVESSIDAVSREIDIEMFVKSNFTGNQKPIPLQFEQHKQYA